MLALAFRISLIAVVLFALLRGERPERIVAAAYAAAAVSTELLRSSLAGRYAHMEWGVFAIDLLLAGALLGVTLSHPAWWTICATALQLVTVLGHVAKLVKPEIWPLAYAWMMQASSFPSLIVLAAALMSSRRPRREPDFS